MKSSTSPRKRPRLGLRSGQSIVEFALTLPLFLAIFFMGVELSMIYMEHHRVMSLSREIASSVFRECADATNKADCIEDKITEIRDGARSVLKEFGTKGTLVGSLYVRDSVTGVVTVTALVIGGTGAAGPDCATALADPATCVDSSKYRPEIIPLPLGKIQVPDTLMAATNYVSIGEVYYAHTAVGPLASLIGAVIPAETYESTIY